MSDLKAPFPYFGGKRKVVDEVWQRFGNSKRYIEPFCGSAAVLLGRPGGAPSSGDELINDLDGFITNFYRTAKQKPDQLAKKLEYPISELDLHARRDWLQDIEDDLVESLRADPHYFHVKSASWWCWGACCWIGKNWPNQTSNQIPCVPSIGGQCINRINVDIQGWMKQLSKRLSKTKIICGDWIRSVRSNAVLNQDRTQNNYTAIFLDPPYPNYTGSSDVYAKDSNSVAYEVEKWCKENEGDPTLRIALCGYEGGYDLPNWDVYEWQAMGGFGNQNSDGNENRNRERIWFSPQCKDVGQETLL